MDPNANIEEQRRIAARMSECSDYEHQPRETPQLAACKCEEDGERLAELVIALDGWLCSGGFLPRTWERK